MISSSTSVIVQVSDVFIPMQESLEPYAVYEHTSPTANNC